MVKGRLTNPFRAGFGVSPPLLVGRDDVIQAWQDALADGPGASGRASIYTGARGVGKTVMLNQVEDLARSRGWLVVSETATAGLVHRLVTEELPKAAGRMDVPRPRRRLTGLTLPVIGGGLDMSVTEQSHAEAGLRTQIEVLTDELDRHGTGLLITIDELQRRVAPEDMRSLSTVIQHAFREERPVAFAGAGLPSAVDELLSDDVLTFLRRADRHRLGAVAPDQVADALAIPIEQAGRQISAAALAEAVAGTGGYPFLIQLVGRWSWQQHPAHTRIDLADARAGVSAATRRLGSLVHEPALRDLSEVDRTFLAAMAHVAGPSRLADIAARLQCTSNYASQYRLRLIAAGIIEPAGYGKIRFALPHLSDYLREHAATLGITPPPGTELRP